MNRLESSDVNLGLLPKTVEARACCFFVRIDAHSSRTDTLPRLKSLGTGTLRVIDLQGHKLYGTW